MRLIILLLALIVVACGTMPYAIPSATNLIARANLPAELLAHDRERALVRVRPLAWDSMLGGAAADYAGQLAAEGGTRPPEIIDGASSPLAALTSRGLRRRRRRLVGRIRQPARRRVTAACQGDLLTRLERRSIRPAFLRRAIVEAEISASGRPRGGYDSSARSGNRRLASRTEIDAVDDAIRLNLECLAGDL